MRNPATPSISSFAAADRTRQQLEACVLEIQNAPALATRIVSVVLADGVESPVAHRLGRIPRFVSVSCPRGAVSAGFVEEIRGNNDRTQIVVLKASGYGATITVDVEFK